MKIAAKFAWGLVLLATILHFDYWLWDSHTIVGGVLPLGLAWQMGISVLASIAWLCVVLFDWPEGVEEWASVHEKERS